MSLVISSVLGTVYGLLDSFTGRGLSQNGSEYLHFSPFRLYWSYLQHANQGFFSPVVCYFRSIGRKG